ncbi:acetoacetate--CoA ligase [Phototrophicus methaneseepsis]|uniref:Acetoacetate--CoA ligase n=1 Tax=Phototrophicus methaneseepsis TaxID=2710758 RepID=A0A7S8ECJ1_9CHLR|nr:acetoacetate--CoA ligase [Phototrophicus methaneseepsis]QPC84468.1 acetoacetate--CoA ligase [Phototrophicus methaneseepsis]
MVLREGDLLWQPTPEMIANSHLTHYMHWLAETHDLHFDTYAALWQWSVTHIEDFWVSLFAFFDLIYSQPWQMPLVSRSMPGTQWFPGMRLNYAENIFSRMTSQQPMMLYKAEDEPLVSLSWQTIYEQVNRLAQVLREQGIQPGDCVVAYLPNIPQAMVAVLAVASLGAIWSSCSPDFGSRSVLDRFSQIEPRVLIAVDGYQYGGKTYERRAVVAELQNELPSLEHTILIPYLQDHTDGLRDTVLWDAVLAEVDPPEQITFAQVPFDHPLWVLYSSGTTGLPKPIVQGHGGILLEHVKATAFHNDQHRGDRFFWYTSTGWMMWNYVLGSLLAGSAIILYNGSPGYPDLNALFELAEQSGMTYFGTSAAFIHACMKADLHPNKQYDLSAIRGVGSTGSPLTVEGFDWVYHNINSHLALESLSGGTDLCTAIVGGVRILPIYAGEIQGASLGAKVQAYNESGQPVVDEVGELVITEPMPSMPLYLWGDDASMSRYQASYFDMFPGIWWHGDWIKFNERGGCVIYGRSDSTINRQGIRMGTSEIYRVLHTFDEIADSLIVDLELLGRQSFLPLFVVLREDETLTEALQERIKEKLRDEVSPRHVPDKIIQIGQVPYTLSGKKMEVPIRKILLGMDAEKAANPGAMRNPESLSFFKILAEQLYDII